MAAKGWDSKTDKLVIDNNIYDEVNKTWIKGEPMILAFMKNLVKNCL